MKRTIHLILIASAIAFISNSVYALTTLTVNSLGSGLDNVWVIGYDGSSMNVFTGERNVTFQEDDFSMSYATFCIEINEAIDLDTYEAIVNTKAIAGGIGGGSPDPLDPETAWIYETYLYGNSYGWSAQDVQLAIWVQEDEITSAPEYQNWTNVTDILSSAAQNAQGIGDVRILNLWTPVVGAKQFPVQDVLIAVPEPTTLLLLTIGAFVLRKKR
jgi:hypothetical protein